MKVEFLQEAYIEFKEAIDFYNYQNKKLGERFIKEIEKTINLIKIYPKIFSLYTKNTRKAVLSTFPYNIIYALEKESIVIIAVAHQHRKPKFNS